jgi:hypothetical protein
MRTGGTVANILHQKNKVGKFPYNKLIRKKGGKVTIDYTGTSERRGGGKAVETSR